MPPKAKTSTSDAAEVLGIYEREVASVDGDVATTSDGQRYRLTGTSRGDWEWLKTDGSVQPAPSDEEADEASE